MIILLVNIVNISNTKLRNVKLFTGVKFPPQILVVTSKNRHFKKISILESDDPSSTTEVVDNDKVGCDQHKLVAGELCNKMCWNISLDFDKSIWK